MDKMTLLEVIRLTAPADVANAVSDLFHREQHIQMEAASLRSDCRHLVKSLTEKHARKNGWTDDQIVVARETKVC